MDYLKLYSRNKKGLDSFVQTICVFSGDIGMEFGIEKSVGIELPHSAIIKIFRGSSIFRRGDEAGSF